MRLSTRHADEAGWASDDERNHAPVSNELRSLLERVADADPDTAKELRRHIDALQSRRQFGLNFERHTPESVALSGRPISIGDKVRYLPPRGETEVESKATWIVTGLVGRRGERVARLVDPRTGSEAMRAVDDLVFVADFRDPIYPGLVSTGKIERGGDRPYHSVVNAENYHALEALLFTHQGKVDCIYIDPPYNTGAKDWKYNNDYVDGEDSYRHSKWLAFMERRLKVAKKLLNPADSVLIATIDEREGHRLGLLLEQTFPEARVQMVSTVINPKGVPKAKGFSRVDEWLFFVMLGDAQPTRWATDMMTDTSDSKSTSIRYVNLKREGSNWQRSARPGLFYPIYADADTGRIVEFGEPLAPDVDRHSLPDREGLLTVWPLKPDGSEARWQQKPDSARRLRAEGLLRSRLSRDGGGVIIEYLSSGQQKFIKDGQIQVVGRDDNGALIVESGIGGTQIPKTLWRQVSHSATEHGSKLLSALLGGRKFPFPKSLYAVEDTLRFFVANKPHATIIDFFSGSGTTAHAVMRLNKQDGGRRTSICVTNNEVSSEQQAQLRTKCLRPGDQEWEAVGICDYITKPRIEAAVTGKTPDGDPINGDYKFTDEFPISDGFEENVEFFTLTYENPALIELDLAFDRIAPLLWMRAGSEGRRIDDRNGTFDVADTYAVLFSVDASKTFLAAVEKAKGLQIAYIVTDDETQYQAVAGQLPDGVESVRLYESYLRTFQINTGRA